MKCMDGSILPVLSTKCLEPGSWDEVFEWAGRLYITEGGHPKIRIIFPIKAEAITASNTYLFKTYALGPNTLAGDPV